METTNIVDFARRDGITDALTDLLRTGAQQLIATAVEAELAGYLAQFSDWRTEAGHAAVVRNGHHPARPFQTGIGPVSVRIPKVRSMDGTPVTFRSALVIHTPQSLDRIRRFLSYSLLLLIRVGSFTSLPIEHSWWFAAKGRMRALLVVELHPLPDASLRF